MKHWIALVVYYNAANYNPIVIEFTQPKFEVVEHLGDGYGLQQKEEEEIKEKEVKEITDYLIYQSLCEPFCL